MDKETEVWYENQFDLFGMQGWKDLMEHTQKIKDSYDQVSTIKDEKELYMRQGQLDVLSWLLTWEASVNTVHKELKDVASNL